MTTRTPEEWKRYDRDRQRRLRASKPSKANTRSFVGVDGEGGDIAGRHLYLLLRAGEQVTENPSGLSAYDCLSFLCDLPRDVIYISYYFDYDVTMMLRDLPPERLRRLLDRESRSMARDGTRLHQAMPVDVGPYQIDYLPRKFFKVRKMIRPEAFLEGNATWDGPNAYGPWLTISDISAFFQCSFVNALKDWEITDPETLAQIERGKAGRADFGAVTDEERAYNASECVLLAELAERFRAVCIDVGYVPGQWQGPGYLAVSMFRKHGIPKTRDIPPQHPDVWEAANSAYYGGRFEITGVGPVAGPIYQYDINSAYPDAITRLPCLQHSTWVDGGLARGNRYVLCYGRFTEKEPAMLYGLPIRDKDGGIYFPGTGAGWYWQHEIKASKHQTFIVERAYSLIENCECVPFSWIPDVYAERKRIGKGARGKVLKLGLNSLYGKTAQSIGGAPYANPIYASLITSLTRAKLQEAVHAAPSCGMGLCGQDVYMLATDAVFTSAPLPLPVSAELGEWDLETHPDGMFIIQPGVYFTSDPKKPKTRGIPQRIVVENAQRFRDAFQDLVNTGSLTPVTVQFQMFIGLRQALHRGKPATAGSWVNPPDPKSDKKVSFDWQNKRHAEQVLPITSGETAIRPLPIPGSPGLVSVPYSKEIGRWRELERLDYWDQPDFASDTFREGED